ncbi:MAG: NAD-dependent epimerase/dehydratase family protein [Victivallales bacterium]|jgi:UDP-glucuronate 4-epimerase|nr:NAD-dependent epimerase/dehydratase family protein [Victivallales bacterium]MBT7161321.1 NAD-dependent epimerase/dehydratase family protein [Victivallales bacterium]MBT7304081.1 NAD-dependent epimerase/dehydratase family protein [Victivallales bacterium]
MKIVITGTAGFIGFHLARHLLAEGHEVVGIDNFSDYYSVELKEDRHRLLEASPGYRGERLDLTEGERLLALVNEWQPDVVCNLAAQAGVRYSLTNPHVYQTANLEGFLNILEACRHADPQPRLVYASSSSVYGGNTKLPFSESDPVDTPVSLYAATKKANELMAHSYSHLFGLQTVGLRFFTVYGPWGRPDMAMWLFTKAMLAGEPIKVFNRGNMQRDFTYVDDIVQGLCGAMFAPGLDQYEIFNLGNHRCENLMDMIGMLSDALGVKPEMELLPMQPGDVPATYADVAKAQAKLGFDPSTPIAAGIPAFVEWYREYHGI